MGRWISERGKVGVREQKKMSLKRMFHGRRRNERGRNELERKRNKTKEKREENTHQELREKNSLVTDTGASMHGAPQLVAFERTA